MQHCRVPSTLRPLAVAALLVLGVQAPLRADITTLGTVSTGPLNLPIGPGDTDLGNIGLYVGSSAYGRLDVGGGSLLRTGSLLLGPGSNGDGSGWAYLDGAGSRIELTGDGFSDSVLNRFEVGAWGLGAMTISGGAVLDGRANAAACLGANHFCNSFIGNAAGSTGRFTVTGAGSSASFLRGFIVGGLAVFRPPIDGFTFGTPGASSSGTVKVLDGASLLTDSATLGVGPGGSSPLGSERSFADALIDGAGSVWRISGGTLENTGGFFALGTHRNSWASVAIRNGGQLLIEGRDGLYNSVGLSTGGGRSDMIVSGAGSNILFTGDAGVLNIGRSGASGSGNLVIEAGGRASGMFYVGVGRDGTLGQLSVQGAGSELLVNGRASAAANGSAALAGLDIGRNGGYGQVTVGAGGRIHLLAEQGLPGLSLNLGRDANSAGTLNIHGPGSVLLMESISVLPGGGPGEAPNPVMRVGRDGSGTLNISDGGKLLLQGGAVSTPADRRSTSLIIGGFNDNTPGGHGIATVSGAGSEIRLSGTDTFIGVGIGPQSSGQLSINNQALVSAIGLGVGRSGGVGVLKLDGGQLLLSGQQTAGNLSGGFLTVGTGAGIGVASIDKGSLVTLSNMGSAGAGLSLGGSGAFPGGEGSLALAGASRIVVEAQPGLGAVTIGREGSGFMRMRGASELDNAGGNLYLGRFSGSDGTLIVSEGSSVTAGWVGVGRNKTATGDADGGTATMVLIDSTLTAQDIVIGSKGFLCGTGSISGNVVNHGIFCPGNSPGTLNLNGDFSAMSGSRMILEVEDDGMGGYLTDVVVFGGAVALGAMAVEFRFLGATNPAAFQSSGRFDIDTFLGRSDGAGGMVALADQSFAGVQFSAQADAYVISNFSFSAADGAAFSAQPVPEPQTWAMLLLGLLGLVLGTRRQRGLTLPG
ncbi:PEP-CTERM sorting domain-containing protein [Paucibacter sp. O1-1]|nr:PEP-CTERM sorting domain-containing protein [Paucibacter sp. O1-1]MDA3826411.1 PEP-CTERM sorting domain-containing protein [Paucibacter sp. O1-1]